VRQHRRGVKDGTFASVIAAYLHSPKFDSLSKSTRTSYSYLLGLAQRPKTLGLLSVSEIRPALVQAFLDGFADKPAQQAVALTSLKACERWALVRDLLPYPITTGCEAPGSDGGHVPWSDEQIALAEQHLKPFMARVITLASNTGQRGSDLIKMTWNDIEEYEGTLGINIIQKKTGLKIWVPMTQELMKAILSWERRPTPILLKEDGQPFTRPQLSDHWFRARGSSRLASYRCRSPS
jgi:integrase